MYILLQQVFHTDSSGKIVINKIAAGQYKLQETVAPKGYELNKTFNTILPSLFVSSVVIIVFPFLNSYFAPESTLPSSLSLLLMKLFLQKQMLLQEKV